MSPFAWTLALPCPSGRGPHFLSINTYLRGIYSMPDSPCLQRGTVRQMLESSRNTGQSPRGDKEG